MTTPAGFGPPIPPPAPYGAPPQVPYGAPQVPYGGPAPAPYGMPAPVPYGAPAAGGPEFVAHDRRNSVIVDPAGVSLEVGGRTVDFPWAGVAAVHAAPGPHGHILMVAVRHPGGMLYECRIDARRRARLHQWLAELGPVLGHYLAHRA